MSIKPSYFWQQITLGNKAGWGPDMIGGIIDAAHAPQAELAVLVEDGQALIPDAATMFRGDYAKDGQDLTISYGDGPDIRVIDFFTTGFPPNLISPNGAQLRGETVVRLAGGEDTRLAQATGNGPTAQELADAIGQVETIEGTVTVTRANGNVVTLGDGDLVFQNDVVATAENSTLSLTFVDGTIFSLSAGSRMVLDELIYDANGSENSAVFNLVQGGFVFIAGEVAPTGDMRIETPTGVLGIRGTTVEVVILTENGISEVLVSLLTDPDGSVGQVEIRDLSGELIAIVTEIDTTWVLSSVEGETREIPRADSVVANDIGLLAQTFAAFQTANARVESGDTYVSQERSNDGATDDDEAPDDTDGDESVPENQDPEGGGGAGPDDDAAAPEGETLEPTPEGQGAQDGLPEEEQNGANPVEPEDGGGVDEPQDDAALDQAPTPEQTAAQQQAATADQATAEAQAAAQDQVAGADLNAATGAVVEPDGTGGATVAVDGDAQSAATADAAGDESGVAGQQLTQDTLADGATGADQAAGLSQPNVQDNGTGQPVEGGGVSLNADGTIALAENAPTAAQTGDAPLASGGSVPVNNEGTITLGQGSLQQAAPTGSEPIASLSSFTSEPTFAFGDSQTFDVDLEPITAAGDLGTLDQPQTLGGDPGLGDVSGNDTPTLSSFSDPIENPPQPIPVTDPGTDEPLGDSPQTPINQPPDASGGSVTFFADQNGRSGVLPASDPEGAPLTFTLVSQPTNGTVTLDPNTGVFDYTPNPGFLGTDSFSYTATDANGATSDTGVVSISYNATNLDPVAAADAATVPEDAAVVVDLLANDSDPENGVLSLQSVGAASNGSVEILNNGSVRYTPEPDFAGTDSFSYVLADDAGGTTTGTATITIVGQNDAPTALDDTIATSEDTGVNIAVLNNDTDLESAVTVTSVGSPANGTAVVEQNGTITYTPDADFFGTDSFTYQISDAEGLTSSATVTVTVTPENDAPVIADDTETTTEDNAVNINVLANDTDAENGPITVLSVGDPSNGTATLEANGSITYTPDADFSGFDSFTYTASDPEGLTRQATVTVSVGAINDDPVAADDAATVLEDGSILIDVLTNDTDPEGNTLTVQSVGTPSSGAAAVQQNGQILYTPDADYFGDDSFSYTVSDGFGGTNVGTVSVTVSPVNDAPVAVDDAVQTNEDTILNIDVLSNDSDVDGDTLTLSGASLASNGSVTLAGDGTINYTPNADFFGDDSFEYTITDPTGDQATGTVTVTVRPVNDPPVAVNDAAVTAEDTSIAIDVLSNDSDADQDGLAVVSLGDAANGSVSLSASGILYTPDANFFGTDSFTYQISDGNGLTSTATVTVSITPLNDAPIAVADGASTEADTAVNIDVLANDSDVDGDTLSVTSVGTASNGTVVLEQNGTVTYTPDAQFLGADSFTYTLSDGVGGTSIGTVNISVGTPNDPPVAVDDSATTDEDTATTINVLVNDTDPDDDPLAVAGVSAASNGTVVVQQDNTILYTPDADFFGTDSFTYTASDGFGGTSVGTVTVTVNAVNDPPDVRDDAFVTTENVSVQGNIFADNGSGADTDPEGGGLTLISATGPNGNIRVDGALTFATGGSTLQINPDGTFEFNPAGLSASVTVYEALGDGESLTETFDYVVEDALGLQSTGTVSILVNGENDAPITAFDRYSIFENDVISGNLLTDGTTAAGADSDPEGDPFEITAFNGVALADADEDGGLDGVQITINGRGQLTLFADGAFTFDTAGAYDYLNDVSTLTQPFQINERLEYTVTDSNGAGSLGVSDIFIQGSNDAPTAVADGGFSTPFETATTISAAALLGNDSDIEGNTLTLTDVGSAVGGLVELNGSDITFTPFADFSGAASFVYTVSDGTDTSTATVSLTVVENQNPVAANDTLIANEDFTGALVGNVIDPGGNGGLDSDPEGGDLTVTAASIGGVALTIGAANALESGGFLTITETGDVSFDADGQYDELTQTTVQNAETFEFDLNYTVSDQGGATSDAVARFVIRGLNDGPVINPDTFDAVENEPLVIDVADLFANDTDVDGTTLTLTTVINPVNGQIVDNGDGTVTFTPDTDFVGEASFIYQAADEANSVAGAFVTINVAEAGNQFPTANDDTGLSTAFETLLQIDPVALTDNDTDPDSDPLQVTEVTSVSGGTVVLNGGQIDFTPDANFAGTAEFTYEISDGRGGTATASAFVDVGFPGGDIVSDFSDGLQGWTVNNDGVASFSATGGNPGGAARADDLEQQVLYYWVAPTAYLGDKSAYSGGTLNFDLLANGSGVNVDNQPDLILRGGGLTIALDIGRPSDSEFTSYTAFLDFRSDWRLNGEGGTAATEAQIDQVLADLTSIEIRGEYQDGPDVGFLDNVVLALPIPNQPPQANGDADYILTGTSANIDVLMNDTDIDLDPLTVTLVDDPTNGTAVIEADGTITYTPDNGFVGTETFTYTVADGVAGTDTGTISIRVAALDAEITSTFDNNLDGWTISDGVSELTWDAAGQFIEAKDDVLQDFFYFVAPSAYLGDKTSFSGGTLSFDLQAFSDGANNNGAPDLLLTGGGITIAANFGRPSEIEFTNFSVFLDDRTNWRLNTEGGAAATQAQIDQVLADLTSLQIRGEYFNTLDEIARLDNVVMSRPDNLAPVAQDDVLENTGNALFTFNVFDDNGNGADADPEGSALTLVSVTNEFGTNQPIGTISQLIQPSGANVRLGADGTFQFFTGGFTTSVSDFERLDEGETLTSTFTYVVEDETGLQDTGNVSITITGVNDRPQASDNGYSLTEDETVSGNFITDPGLGGVVDFDFEGTPLTLVSIANRPIATADDDPNSPGIQVTFGSGAILTVATDGSFTFDTNGAYEDITGLNINTGVNYQIADETGLIDTGFINFNIAPVNDAPVAVDDATSTAEDTPVTIDVLANDTDVDNDAAALFVDSFDQPTNGTVVLELDGRLTYTPNTGFSGPDTFDYTVIDGSGGAATATVTVNVTNTNVPPVAVEDTYTVDEDGFLNVPAGTGVLSNDNDADGDGLSVSLQSDVSNGSLTLNADGSFDYTPDADFNGNDGFIYTLTDGSDTVSGSVEITVDPVNDPVVINAITGDDQLDLQEQTNPVQISGTAEVNGSVLISFGAEQQTVSTDANGNYSTTFSADVIPDATTVLVTVDATDEFGNVAGTNSRLVSIDQPSTDATITVAGAISNFDFPLNPGDFNINDMPYEAIFDEIDANTFVERSLTINSATEIRWTADDGRTFAFVGTDLNYNAGTGLVTGLQFGSPTDPDFFTLTGLSNTLGEIKQIIADTIIPGGLDEAPFNGLFSQYALTYNGSEGRDEIDFSGFSQFGDTYFGNGGDDEFWGGLGDDTYFGGEGDDFFLDSQGNNSFNGGNGDFDFVSYEDATGAVDVNLNTGVAFKTDGTTDSLTEINGIVGSSFADTIQLDDNAETNIVLGLAGDDTLTGGAFSTDILDYSRESRFTSNTTGVVVNLAAGLATDLFGNTDVISGFEGVIDSEFGDTLTASDDGTFFIDVGGNDSLISGAGDDNFSLGAGNDTIVYTSGEDFVQNFVFGEDTIELQGDALTFINSLTLIDASVPTITDTVIFEFTDDQSSTFSLTVSDLTLTQAEQIVSDLGLGGGDIIVDNALNEISGTSGDDNFLIQPGTPPNGFREFDGSLGNDTYDFTQNDFQTYNQINYNGLSSGPIAATINLNGTDSTVNKGSAGNDTLVAVQSSADWGFGVIGTQFNDTFVVNYDPSAFSFALIGGAGGQDTITMNGGGDGILRLQADAGPNITAVLDNGAGGGSVNAANGDTYTLIYNGDVSNNRIELNTGNGNDSVLGTPNDDRFILSGGDDTVDGGDGRDALRYNRNQITSGVTVDFNAGTATGGWEGATFTHSFSNIEEAWGSSFGDLLIGSDTFEVFLDGNAGNDTIVGGQARTGMYLREGNDSVIYSNGNDFVLDFNPLEDSLEIAGVALTNIGSLRIQIDDQDIAGGGTATRLQFDIDDTTFFGINLDNVSNQEAYGILQATFDTFTTGVTIGLSSGDGFVYGSPGDDDITLQGRNAGDFENARASVGDDIYRLVNVVPNNYHEIDYRGLGDVGITANLNVDAAQSTITKGRSISIGTDTLTGLLDAADNGIGIFGTIGDDVWNVTQSSIDNGFLAIYNFGGTDVLNLISGRGTLQVNMGFDAGDVVADLAAGTVSDTISGDTWQINYNGGDRNLGRLELATGAGNDDILGSAFNERFILRAGSDTVDGGGNGFDRDIIKYDRRGVDGGVTVNLSLATAVVTGFWDGQAFSHTLIDIEGVRGSRFNDVLTLGDASAELVGNEGNDSLTSGIGDNYIELGAGADTLVFTAGFDFVEDFDVNEDTLQLQGAALANANTLNVYDDSFDGNQRVNFDFTDGNTDFQIRFKNITLEEGLQIADDLGLSGGQTFNVASGDQNVVGTVGDDTFIKLAGTSNDFEDTSFNASFGNDTYDFSSNRSNEYIYMDYAGLGDIGITANLNLDGPDSTIQKSTFGTDTLIGVQAASDAGFEITGTRGDDVFNATLNSSGFTQLELGFDGGQDTASIVAAGSGRVVLKATFDQIDVAADLSNVTVDGTGFLTTSEGDRADVTFTGDFTDFGLRVDTRNGDDDIIGSGLDDQFILRAGLDTVDGGGGSDTLRFDRSQYNTAINMTLGNGTVSGEYDGQAYTYFYSSIEGVRGTNQGDTLIAGDFDSNLEGRSGNDRIVTGIGDDYARLDQGNDTLVYSAGFDFVQDFNTVDDTLELSGAALANTGRIRLFESFVDGNIETFIEFRDANDTFFGLSLRGLSNFETATVLDSIAFTGISVTGTTGDDDVVGTLGNDTIDLLSNDGGFDRAFASFGDDTYIFTNNGPTGFQEIDYSVLGNTGIDVTIDFNTANGTVDKGAAGFDTLVDPSAAAGGDGLAIVGSRGDDSFDIFQRTDAFSWVGIYHEGGTDTVNFDAGQGILRLRIEADGSDVSADIGNGLISAGNGDVFNLNLVNVTDSFRLGLETGNGNDTILGSNINEEFILGAGTDSVDAGGGFDRVRYNRSDVDDGVIVNLQTQTATGIWDGQAFTHTLVDIERVDGSRFADDITGSGLDDHLEGRGGNDAIDGGAGNDLIIGTGGDVDLLGGAGDDQLFWNIGTNSTIAGGSDFDEIAIFDSGSFDFSNVNVGGNVTGIERINLENGNGSDALTLTAQNVLDFAANADALLSTAFGDALSIVGDVGDQLNVTQGDNYGFVGTAGDAEGRTLNVYEYSEGAGVLAVVAVDDEVTVNQVA